MRVLVSAYACEPDRGSEPGAGWQWTLAAARRHDVTVLTRTTNRANIEAELAERPHAEIRFVYLDLPAWARSWKKKNRGVRLYYTLWQLLARRAARRLHHERSFDLVHSVTFANMWLPQLAFLPGVPFVLGPLGGGQRVPPSLYGVLGARSTAIELILLGGRACMRLNPLVRAGWRRADVILAQNEETRDALPRHLRDRVILRPNAVVPDALRQHSAPDTDLVAAVAGRLNRFKAPTLAIRALAAAPAWRLVVIGRGPEEARVRALADELGVADRVRYLPWLSQEDLWRELSRCRALLFPSLKEGAPWVCAEAQALGLPVVALDRAGPRVFAGFAHARFELVAPGTRAEVTKGLADALRRLETEPRPHRRPDFSADSVARDLERIYAAAATSPGRVAAAGSPS